MEEASNLVASGTKRDAGIEVFRVLLMFSIVQCHCWLLGAYYQTSLAWGILNAALLWHVDGFVSITGWYGIRFKWQKFFRLYGVICFYSVLGWAWRGVCALAVVDGLGLRAGGVVPFFLTLFAFLYVCMGLIRRSGKTLPCSKLAGITVFGLLLSVTFSTLLVLVLKESASRYGWIWKANDYLAPHTLVVAMGLTVLFAKYNNIPNWLAKVCRFLGPSMFGVYLLHLTSPWGNGFYVHIQQYLIKNGIGSAAIGVPISALATFVFCVAIDLLRRGALCCIRNVCATRVSLKGA